MVDGQGVSFLPFHFGVIPSEIDADFDVSLSIAAELGLSEIEVSEVDGVQLPDLLPAQVASAAERARRAGMTIRVCGAQTFKPLEIGPGTGDVLDLAAVRAQFEQLDAALAVTKQFGAPILRLYAFRREDMIGLGNPSPILPDGGTIPDRIIERGRRVLHAAGDRAAALGMTLAVENVRSCWANTGVNVARLIAAADHPAVRICWDPANDFVGGGEPATTGYAAVRDYVVTAHFKDAVLADPVTGLTAWTPIGDGSVDPVAQLRLLAADGFTGLASLETHWRAPNGSKADGSRQSFAGLARAAQEAVAVRA